MSGVPVPFLRIFNSVGEIRISVGGGYDKLKQKIITTQFVLNGEQFLLSKTLIKMVYYSYVQKIIIRGIL